MMNQKKKLGTASWIAFTYVGTVVGAGFASGQEIMAFFTIYGIKSFWAIMISCILFILIGIRILLLGMELRASSFRKLIDTMFGFLSPFISIYLLFSMMIINVAMLAGAGAIFQEFGETSYLIGVASTAFIAIIAIGFGIRGILSINKIVVLSVLVLLIFALLITLFTNSPIQKQARFVEISPIHLITRGISYASYNLILSMGVLANLGYEFKDKKVLRLGGLIGGSILGAMLLSIHYCLLEHMPDIFDYEIPMFYIISNGSWFISVIYAFVIWGAIFTTLLGNLFSVTSFLYDKYRIHHMVSAIIIVCLGSLLAPLGFSSIINTLYPIIGLIGVAFIIAILYNTKSRKS